MSSTDSRAQSIIEELSQDELAGYILETVDAGPFVRTFNLSPHIHDVSDTCLPICL